jgi:ferredoxin-NADP reductase
MKVKLIKKEEIARDTKSFYFEPQEPVNWKPGEYFYYTLPQLKYPDDRGGKRQFTCATSPTEGSTLMITTRMKSGSGFKRTLDELPEGTLIDAEGPHGVFVVDETVPGEHVFIAGGIGITPFRSIIKYNVDKGLTNTTLHLIYANSTPEEIAFKSELEQWASQHPNVNVHMTVSHPEESQTPWTGLTGRVDEAMIKKLVPNYTDPSVTFWLCGPPPMVDAMDEMLGKAGIPTARRKIEKFTGY